MDRKRTHPVQDSQRENSHVQDEHSHSCVSPTKISSRTNHQESEIIIIMLTGSQGGGSLNKHAQFEAASVFVALILNPSSPSGPV